MTIRLILLLSYFSVTSCFKEKRYENRVEGNTFRVYIWINGGNKVDNNDEPILISFDNCRNTKDLCLGKWMSQGTAEFYWKFDENGKNFQFSNISTMETQSISSSGLLYCYELSGVYSVKSFKKNSLSIESTKTVGYMGQNVELTFEKQ